MWSWLEAPARTGSVSAHTQRASPGLATRVSKPGRVPFGCRQMADFSRKLPRQLRAQNSVACILEASAQLLDRTQIGSVTTNHIAERAGVSVGTLYRYFKDKDDIFTSLARSEMTIMARKGIALLNDPSIDSGNTLIDDLVDIAAEGFNQRPLVRKNLHEIIGTRSPIARELQLRRLRFCRLIEDRLHHIEPRRFRTLEREDRLCLVMAWRGIINDTLTEDPSRFHRGAVRKLLSGVVLSYFEP
ncbi:MAG: TetR/AcrR family transcriptional regulator [Alphaproteobacteria bacterium]|nr:MAG: TetR/AcrR family transcriptional regulator [Alphaproteobacteria bacterium]